MELVASKSFGVRVEDPGFDLPCEELIGWLYVGFCVMMLGESVVG